MSSLYDLSAKTLNGEEKSLRDFAGQALLIVNTASRCGYTPQYEGLEALHRKYKARGFSVVGFPCNQFGAQEPGESADIARFCSTTYDVTFPMFAKIDVNGPQTHPLYQYLKSNAKGLLGCEAIKWNFTKFLVGRNGEVVARFGPATAPGALEPEIERLL